MSDKSVFDKMEISMRDLFEGVQKYHGEYFVSGLFIGLTKPQFGWALFALISIVPTLVILKHPEWLSLIKDEKTEHLLLLMLLIMSSDMYALHCLGKSLGYNWP